MARATLPADGLSLLPSLHAGTDPRHRLRSSLAELWARGQRVDWRALTGPPPREHPGLPTYPFQRQRHWLPDAGTVETGLVGTGTAPPGTPLRPSVLATALPQTITCTQLSTGNLPFLSEHRVHGYTVVPGVAYLELLLASARQSPKETEASIADLALHQPLVLPNGELRQVQVTIDPPNADTTRTARLYSQDPNSLDTWHHHVTATLRPASENFETIYVNVGEIRARCATELSQSDFYERLWPANFEIGDSFRLIEHVQLGNGEAIARVSVPSAEVRAMRDGVRPELLVLDACVQVLVAAATSSPGPVLPGSQRPVALGTGYRTLRVVRSFNVPSWVWCHAVHRDEGPLGRAGDLQVLDENGLLLAEILGVEFRRVTPSTLEALAGAASSSQRADERPHPPPRAQLESAGYDECQRLVEQYLADQLGDMLKLPRGEVELDRPLVDVLDSLMLAELHTYLQSDLGSAVPMQALLEEPTVRELAARLATEIAGNEITVDANAVFPSTSRMSVAALLEKSQLSPDFALQRVSKAPRQRTRAPAALLTGATGFLGAFLLQELLQQTDNTVLCLVRGSSRSAALQRITQNMLKYGLPDVVGAAPERIVPVKGDLSEPQLGLEPIEFSELAAKSDAVYHCGATVNWTYSYSRLAPANVAGTRELLRLATMGSPLPFHFISTVGVFSSTEYSGGVVTETEDLETSGGLSVGYAQSKWVAERMVRTMASRGLPVTVYRPNIGAHSSTGAFNAHDHLSLMIKGCIELGLAPISAQPLQPAPVDFVSRAAVRLSLDNAAIGRTFHLVNPQVTLWSELFDDLRERGHNTEKVPFAEWRETLIASSLAGISNASSGLLPFFVESFDQARLPVFDCSGTSSALAGTGIACPPFDAGLLQIWLTRMTRTGFLNLGSHAGRRLPASHATR